jgi:hypothetical protein
LIEGVCSFFAFSNLPSLFTRCQHSLFTLLLVIVYAPAHASFALPVPTPEQYCLWQLQHLVNARYLFPKGSTGSNTGSNMGNSTGQPQCSSSCLLLCFALGTPAALICLPATAGCCCRWLLGPGRRRCCWLPVLLWLLPPLQVDPALHMMGVRELRARQEEMHWFSVVASQRLPLPLANTIDRPSRAP